MDNVQDGPATIAGWLESYLAVIEQPTDIEPLPSGWVRVPCPQADCHPVDPRTLPPTFAVNVLTGLCRCPVCSLGGGELALYRALRKFAPNIQEANTKELKTKQYEPVLHDEVNVRIFPAWKKHFYREPGGKAFCVAMSCPAVEGSRFMGDTVYAHRDGDKWLWGMGDKRMLYHAELLDRLAELKLVAMVGNEDSADAVQTEFNSVSSGDGLPEAAATTWIGTDGSWRYTKEIGKTLRDANVLFWPDQRQQSISTMLTLADSVVPQTRAVWFVDVGRSGFPSGCTPAEALRDGASFFEIIRRYGMRVDVDSMRQRRLARRYDSA